MPMLELQLPATLVAPDDEATLVEDLTATLLHHRGVPDTAASRANLWAFVRHDAQWAGGRRDQAPRVVVRVTFVEGGLAAAAKPALVGDVTRAVQAVAPVAAEHVWVLLDEVPDGHWGAGGTITRLADAQAILTAAE